jgi:SSS family solute:Na+ symporter
VDPGIVALVVCGIYLAVTLVAGVVPGFKTAKSVEGFVAASRSMGPVLLYFVLGASIFSAFAFLGGPGWAYSRGAAALYILSYGVLGMVPLYFFGPRARRLGERFGFVTQAELLAHRFQSRALSVLLAVLSVAVFIPYLTLQMKGAGYILATLSGGRIGVAAGAAVTYLVVLIYVLTSGVLGVGWTNALQGVFMMVVAWTLGLWLPIKLYGGVGAMFEAIAASDKAALLTAPGLDGAGQPWGWAAFSSAVIVSAAGFSVWPHLFMRSFAARSDRALKLTVVMYPTFQLFLVPILLIGFAGVLAFPGVTPADTILPHMLSVLELSPLLVGLVAAGTLAASMSSGDAILHSAASIGVHDGLKPLLRARGGLGDRAERLAIRLAAVAISLVAFYFAVVSDVSLVALLLGAYGGVAQIFPPVAAALYWPRATGKGALAGLVAGLAVNALLLRHPELAPIAGVHEGVWGLAVNVPVLVVVSLLTKRHDAEHVRAYTDA